MTCKKSRAENVIVFLESRAENVKNIVKSRVENVILFVQVIDI